MPTSVWLALMPCLAAAAPWVAINLTSIDPAAVCVDGSPSQVHLEQPAAETSHWVIVFEGGGACRSFRSCKEECAGTDARCRATEPFGAGEGEGPLSSDPAANPAFYSYNKALILYCSRDLFLGRRPPDATTFGLAFQGDAIARAAVHLIAQRFRSNTRVVLWGVSGGCLAVSNHLDWIVARYGPRVSSISAVFDSGYMVNYGGALQNSFQRHDLNLSAAIAERCSGDFEGAPCCVQLACALPPPGVPVLFLGFTQDTIQWHYASRDRNPADPASLFRYGPLYKHHVQQTLLRWQHRVLASAWLADCPGHVVLLPTARSLPSPYNQAWVDYMVGTALGVPELGRLRAQRSYASRFQLDGTSAMAAVQAWHANPGPRLWAGVPDRGCFADFYMADRAISRYPWAMLVPTAVVFATVGVLLGLSATSFLVAVLHHRRQRLQRDLARHLSRSGLLMADAVGAPRAAAAACGPCLAVTDVYAEVRAQGGAKRILHGVSATVCPGRLMAIMGPSGSGKSTLIKYLAMRPDQNAYRGARTIGGANIDRRNFLAHLQSIGYVPQGSALPCEGVSVMEALYVAALLSPRRRPWDERKVHIASLLEAVGLSKQAHSQVRFLSGGERLCLSVALEMAKDPRVLIMDEPTSGLDSVRAQAIVNVLLFVAHRLSVAVVVSIHQPSQRLLSMFDDLLLLVKGRSLYCGPVACAKEHLFELLHNRSLFVDDTISLTEVLSKSMAEELEGLAQPQCPQALPQPQVGAFELAPERPCMLISIHALLLNTWFKLGWRSIWERILMVPTAILVIGVLPNLRGLDVHHAVVAINLCAVVPYWLLGLESGSAMEKEHAPMLFHELRSRTVTPLIGAVFLLVHTAAMMLPSVLLSVALTSAIAFPAHLNWSPTIAAILTCGNLAYGYLAVCGVVLLNDVVEEPRLWALVCTNGLLCCGTIFGGFVYRLGAMPRVYAWLGRISPAYWVGSTATVLALEWNELRCVASDVDTQGRLSNTIIGEGDDCMWRTIVADHIADRQGHPYSYSLNMMPLLKSFAS